MKNKTILKKKQMKQISKDTYNLDYSFCTWIIERLKYLKEYKGGYPTALESAENWDNVLQEMIDGFQDYLNHDLCPLTKEDEGEKLHKSLDLFKEYFSHLWI